MYGLSLFSFFLNIFFKFIFWREGKGGRKRGRETLMCERYIEGLPLTPPQPGTWPTTQAGVLSGNWTCDLSACRPALNPLSHIGQGWFSLFMTWVASSLLRPPPLPCFLQSSYAHFGGGKVLREEGAHHHSHKDSPHVCVSRQVLMFFYIYFFNITSE